MRKGFNRILKTVVVVDFHKKEVVEDYENILDHSPEALEAMASEFLGEDSVDSCIGICEEYRDDLGTDFQGADVWERFMLLQD